MTDLLHKFALKASRAEHISLSNAICGGFLFYHVWFFLLYIMQKVSISLMLSYDLISILIGTEIYWLLRFKNMFRDNEFYHTLLLRVASIQALMLFAASFFSNYTYPIYGLSLCNLINLTLLICAFGFGREANFRISFRVQHTYLHCSCATPERRGLLVIAIIAFLISLPLQTLESQNLALNWAFAVLACSALLHLFYLLFLSARK